MEQHLLHLAERHRGDMEEIQGRYPRGLELAHGHEQSRQPEAALVVAWCMALPRAVEAAPGK